MFPKKKSNGAILIVDDNPTNLEVLSDTLTADGFQVAVAIDGETALEQLKYYQAELIILDIMMPGIDGFETCKRLQSNPLTCDIPVIFATALSDVSNKLTGLSLGAVDYITKPFQCEEVLARIQIQLKLRKLDKVLKEQNVLLKQEILQRQAAENLLKKLNQELEKRVYNRTIELSKTLQQLEQTQVQLVHNEKMSSLGRLVAGIAHEINNPINFIYANLHYAMEHSQNLFTLLELCQKNLTSLPSEIQHYFQEVDFEYLQEDLPKILSSMEVGSERISQIVLSLRNFSRLDEAHKKSVNIHEGIESTLLILQERLNGRADRQKIQVIRAYGELPLVECYASHLNQVFMNLLINAIDALDEQNSPPLLINKLEPPTIWIRTEISHQNWVKISISDNGSGIPTDIQSKIFDPFFTTKPVGKGTGLGLSISYQIIVEKHHGQLSCYSEIGKRTEFVINIPC
ncbi:hybrid sensor histidine kinase/response regulator [Nodularia sp. NIES-3585]|uniref:hybrid sensor histidine kinase/response regulator n=1 Tax=Nodularia sp. NIES-3585 TaxID=1973477 RepID=UPI000B5C3EAC|nr:response regulator [Nodularia sp. NIES-3585]GAX37797.1 response regulator receiver sensor signal transduction histidine kinase [Nodularia sp. NIES-3585]